MAIFKKPIIISSGIVSASKLFPVKGDITQLRLTVRFKTVSARAC